jgi:hypothetical protein
MKKILLAAIITIASVSIASAQPAMSDVCSKRDYMIKLLYNQYSENPFAIGLAKKGHVIELFLSPGGRTWTLVATATDGTSCFLDAGTSWIMDKKGVRSEEAKAVQ